MIHFVRQRFAAGIALIMLLSPGYSYAEEWRAWMRDINGDGYPDIVLSPKHRVIPISKIIIPLASDQGRALCSISSSAYQYCDSGEFRIFSGSEFDVSRVDIDGDGNLDFFLRSLTAGADSFLLLSAADGTQSVAMIIEGSSIDGFDISIAGAEIGFVDANGDGLLDLRVFIPGMQPLIGLLSHDLGTNQISSATLELEGFEGASSVASSIQPATKPSTLPIEYGPDGLGNFTASIPLSFPIRYESVTANLSLQYSSAAASSESPLGAGWSLGGIPTLSRCNYIYAIDGQSHGYRFQKNLGDVYCSASGRLIHAFETYARGQMLPFSGGDNWVETYLFETYETTAQGGRVHYKEQFRVPGTYDHHGWYIHTWAARSITDELGKGVTIQYRQDGTVPLVESITYYDVTIDFSYSDSRKVVQHRGAIEPIVGGGGALPMVGGQLLTKITASVNGSPIRTYNLGYKLHHQTGSYVLESVQDCSDDAVCAVAAEFDYQGEDALVSIEDAELFAASALAGADQVLEADWNDDGRTDVIAVNSEQGTIVANLNGGGQVTIAGSDGQRRYAAASLLVDPVASPSVIYNERPQQAESFSYLQTVLEYYNKVQVTVTVYETDGDASNTSTRTEWRCPAGTFSHNDGEGLPPCKGTRQETVTISVYRNIWKISNGSVPNGLQALPDGLLCYPESDYPEVEASLAFLRPTVVDWDGDGDSDVIVPRQGECNLPVKWTLYRNEDGIYQKTSQTFGSADGTETYAGMAEINGDRSADVLLFRSVEGADASWNAVWTDQDPYNSRPTETLTAQVGLGSTATFEDIPTSRTIPVDLNADGRTDMLSIQDASSGDGLSWYVYINNGRNFEAKYEAGPAPDVDPAAERTGADDIDIRPFLYNADRYPDLLVPGDEGKYQVLVTIMGSDGLPRFAPVPTEIPVASEPRRLRTADFNGDGNTDIALFENDQLTIYHVARSPGALLTNINNVWPGISEDDVAIGYSKLGPDSPAYSYTSGSEGANRSVPAAHYAVTSIDEPDGIGGRRATTFGYDSLVINTQGLGALGFLETTSKNTALDRRTVSTFANGVVPGTLVLPQTSKDIFVESSGTLLVDTDMETEVRWRLSCSTKDVGLDGSYSGYVESLPLDLAGATCPYDTRRTVHVQPLAVRTRYFLESGDEFKAERVAFTAYDRQGNPTARMTQVGLGAAASGSCTEAASCLGLALVHHQSDEIIDNTYVDYDSGEARAQGPLLHRPGSLQSTVSYGGDYAPAEPNGTWYGLSTSALTAPMSSESRWGYLNHMRLALNNQKQHWNTSLATESTRGLIGYYWRGWTTSALSPAAALVDNNGDPRAQEDCIGFTSGLPKSYGRCDSGAMIEGETWNTRHAFTHMPTEIQDQVGLKRYVNYDDFGDVLSETSAQGVITTYNRFFCTSGGCPAYLPDAVTGVTITQNDVSVSHFYDLLGREIGSFEDGSTNFASGAYSYVEHDARGRVVAQVGPVACEGSCLTGSSTEVATIIQYDDANDTVTTHKAGGGTITEVVTAGANGGRVISRNESVSGNQLWSDGGSTQIYGALIGWQTTEDVLGNVVHKLENSADAPNTIATEFMYDPAGNLVWSRVNGDDDSVVVRQYDIAGNLVNEFDPDRGHIQQQWSVLGELLSVTHAGLDGVTKRVSTYSYDGIGRQVKADINGEEVVSWVYDNTGALCPKGYLCQLKDQSGNVSETYSYNVATGTSNAGQLVGRSLSIQAAGEALQTFSFAYQYGSDANLEFLTYPGGFTLQHDYQNGHLKSVQDDATGAYLWQANQYGAFGLKGVQYGNGVTQTLEYHPARGSLTNISAYLPGADDNKVQGTDYSFDSRGRLHFRMLDDAQASTAAPGKALRDYRERFTYDAWNRVKGSEVFQVDAGTITSAATESYSYDALGNLINSPTATGMAYGSHSYAGACATAGGIEAPGPHAVRHAAGVNYCYNTFGELISAGSRQYTWSAYHTAPVAVTDGTTTTTFQYGPDGAKRYQQVTSASGTAARWFAGDGYELEIDNATSTTRIYLGDYAVMETTGGVTETRYLLRDHLGSVEVIMDDDATDGDSIYDSVIEFSSFAPFGARRDTDWAGSNAGTPAIDEGFTGHQMLDQFGLIHMNGRVYDPAIGRFLSPDIVIQAPYFSQSYNRYSYVMNGPLGAVDPSGYTSYSPMDFGDAVYGSEIRFDEILGNEFITSSAVLAERIPGQYVTRPNGDPAFDRLMLRVNELRQERLVEAQLSAERAELVDEVFQVRSGVEMSANALAMTTVGYYNHEIAWSQKVGVPASGIFHLPGAARSAERFATRLSYVGYAYEGYKGIDAAMRGDYVQASHHGIAVAYASGSGLAGSILFGSGGPVTLVGGGTYAVSSYVYENTNSTLITNTMCSLTNRCMNEIRLTYP